MGWRLALASALGVLVFLAVASVFASLLGVLRSRWGAAALPRSPG